MCQFEAFSEGPERSLQPHLPSNSDRQPMAE